MKLSYYTGSKKEKKEKLEKFKDVANDIDSYFTLNYNRILDLAAEEKVVAYSYATNSLKEVLTCKDNLLESVLGTALNRNKYIDNLYSGDSYSHTNIGEVALDRAKNKADKILKFATICGSFSDDEKTNRRAILIELFLMFGCTIGGIVAKYNWLQNGLAAAFGSMSVGVLRSMLVLHPEYAMNPNDRKVFKVYDEYINGLDTKIKKLKQIRNFIYDSVLNEQVKLENKGECKEYSKELSNMLERFSEIDVKANEELNNFRRDLLIYSKISRFESSTNFENDLCEEFN